MLRKCNESKSIRREVWARGARRSRAQREKGRPGVVLLSDSFEYLQRPTCLPPSRPTCIVSSGCFSSVPMIPLYCGADVASEENKTWDQLSPDCGWKPFICISVPGGTPRSRASARSNIFSLMDSLHYSSDPQLFEKPHTTRASELFFL